MKATNSSPKETYVTPAIEVIQMENEGVIASSAEDYRPIVRSRSISTRNSYNAASSNDLEDLINDILTIEN